MRNTVGFDFDPKGGSLGFTDNQRDWLSEDPPEDELNHVTRPGKDHFGYPYCRAGDFADPEFGWGKSCDDVVKPVVKLGPHSAPLGMRFSTPARCSRPSTRGRSSSPATARGTGPRSTPRTSSSPIRTARAASRASSRS